MAEILPRHYLYGVLAFTLFIVGGVSMLGILGDANPSVTASPEYARFNQSFNRLQDVTETVGSLETGITDAQTDFGAFGVLNALISSAWNTLKLMFTSFGVMDSAYTGLSAVFGVPLWIPGLIVLAVSIMIAFTIYSALFQKEL